MNCSKEKLENYTLKEVSKICSGYSDCSDCPFHNNNSDYDMLTCLLSTTPEKWRLEEMK